MTPLEQILQRFREKFDSEPWVATKGVNDQETIESLITEAFEAGRQAMYEDVYSRDVQSELRKEGFAAAIGKMGKKLDDNGNIIDI